MPLNKESARQLVRLQEQDKVIDAIQASIDKIPVAIAGIRQEMENRKSRLAEAKTKGTSLQLKKKEKEIEMGSKEEAIKKRGGELNTVKSNEAFKAIQAEIDKGKAEVSELETAILTLMDEIDQAARDEKAVAAELKTVDAQSQAEIQAFENDKAGLEAKAAAEREKRTALLAGIDEDVLKHYDYLRKRRQGQALSPVNKNMCGACRITLPPQAVVEVLKGKLVTCEACQRILYMTEAPKAAAPAAPPAS